VVWQTQVKHNTEAKKCNDFTPPPPFLCLLHGLGDEKGLPMK